MFFCALPWIIIMKQLLTLLFLSMFSFAVFQSEDGLRDHYDDHGDHAHHPGDIIVEVEGGQIEVDTGVSILYKGNPAKLFESEFGEGLNPCETDEPGFIVEEDHSELVEHNALAFQITSPLLFWDGSTWGSAGSASLDITNLLGDVTTVDASSGVLTSIIDEADDHGGVHTHVDFEIDSNAATGGYLLEFVLKGYDSYDPATDSFGAEIASSDTILIAFNNGMDEHDFEDGVSAIPVPAAAWLFISAISSLLIGRRLKK